MVYTSLQPSEQNIIITKENNYTAKSIFSFSPKVTIAFLKALFTSFLLSLPLNAVFTTLIFRGVTL